MAAIEREAFITDQKLEEIYNPLLLRLWRAREGGGNMSKGVMGGGAIFVAILMVLTQYFNLPGYLHYVWAALVLVWGVIAFK